MNVGHGQVVVSPTIDEKALSVITTDGRTDIRRGIYEFISNYCCDVMRVQCSLELDDPHHQPMQQQQQH